MSGLTPCKIMKYLLIFMFIGYSSIAQDQVQTNAPMTRETITNLVLAIWQQPHSEGEYAAKESSIKQAAHIHNPDSQIIAALLDNLSYVAKQSEDGHVPVFSMNAPKYSRWPANDALVKIGEPVIPALLERLKIINDEKKLRGYMFLLEQIAGKKRCSELMKRTISDLSEQQDRLKKCLALLQ